MESWILARLITSIGVVAVSGVGLIAFWLYLRAKRQALQDQLAATAEVGRAEVESLRAEMQGRIDELHERLDFAERLLSQGTPPKAIDRPIRTPV